MNVTEQFIEYILKKASMSLPNRIMHQAKTCLLDYIGVTCAGAAQSQTFMKNYLKHNCGEGKVSLIGLSRSSDVLTAAFVNGFHAHVMELDDGHRFGMIHLAAPVISAVLSVAQNENAAGEALLKGIVIGYEAAVRLAVAIQPVHKTRGYHTAGTCGTIGAAVGAGIVLHLNKEQLKVAVSAAGTSAAGLLEIQEDNSDLKPYNTGHAAMSGVNAAYMGMTEFNGPDDILGGKRGLTNVLSDGAEIKKMTFENDKYEIERIYMKLYAACRHCHSAIEAAMMIRKQTHIKPNDIVNIHVDTYGLAVTGHDHILIQGVSSAKLSIPFSVSAAYILLECGPDAFSLKNVRNKEILALMQKISIRENEEFSKMSPERRIAEITLTDVTGENHIYRVDYAKGDPENPLTVEEIISKYCNLMKISAYPERAEKLLKAVDHVMKDISDLYLYL